ncbi:hypothetical protein L6452_09818 [Arctium lappa]|uniref:Uncharacterized protein n=1 Tax=Arctium lappa TaxID=4217 RepID=A0ACB9DL41_ARCLA|nr:hypothetical protein L6452_09818 [Arctium lappa]
MVSTPPHHLHLHPPKEMMAFIIVQIVVPQEEPHLGLITKRNKLECSPHLFITSASVERRAEIGDRRATGGDEQSKYSDYSPLSNLDLHSQFG